MPFSFFVMSNMPHIYLFHESCPFDFKYINSSVFFIAVQTHFSPKCIVRVVDYWDFSDRPVFSVYVLVILGCLVFVLTY